MGAARFMGKMSNILGVKRFEPCPKISVRQLYSEISPFIRLLLQPYTVVDIQFNPNERHLPVELASMLPKLLATAHGNFIELSNQMAKSQRKKAPAAFRKLSLLGQGLEHTNNGQGH